MIDLMEAPPETRTLAELETIIERGLETFIEVGKALAQIQERKLYRASHETFGEYCTERWGISRPRAYQLIGAARVVSTVVDKGLPPPSTERVARELAPMLAEPEVLATAWSEAIEQHGPTATAVQVAAVSRPQWKQRRLPQKDPATVVDNITESLTNLTDMLVERVPQVIADAEHRDPWIKALRLTRARVNKALRTLEESR